MPAKPVLWLMLAAIALAAAGCAPKYRTFTTYSPPEDQGGRRCLARCQDSRQHCRQSASLEVQQCRIDAQGEAQGENLRLMADYQIKLRQFKAGYSEAPPEPPATVRPDYWGCENRAGGLEQQCTSDYDLCYQNCGGTVTYTTRCVANCEDVQGY